MGKKKMLPIDFEDRKISVSRQAELLGISRSSAYYAPVIDPYDEELTRLIDEQYTEMPFYDSRRMTAA